jgi:hypothetical protein
LVEAYLRGRGIEMPLPTGLRFHPNLKHPSGSWWPGLVAAVVIGESDGNIAGIHRTFLARDGSAKAPVEPQKMTLGPCRSGAVRLASASEQLMVGEGIETCLAAMQATGRPAWAALSTSGLRALGLAPGVRDVIVLADGDDAGETAARRACLCGVCATVPLGWSLPRARSAAHDPARNPHFCTSYRFVRYLWFQIGLWFCRFRA